MKKRLFAAIHVQAGEQALAVYYRLQKELQHENIKWVKPDLFHLTLKFFGETEESEIEHINAIFSQLASHITPFNINLNKTGIFGSRYAPRVIWFGFDQEALLKTIGMEVLSQCDRQGFSSDRQNFVPHLTIARIRSINNKKGFQNSIRDNAEFMGNDFEVKKISLFESVLKPSGPVYYELEKYQLEN